MGERSRDVDDKEQSDETGDVDLVTPSYCVLWHDVTNSHFSDSVKLVKNYKKVRSQG